MAEILELSESKSWHQARSEWTLAEVRHVDDPETCLCGHFPIIEICSIKNRLNGRVAEVGNICVKKFMGLPSHKIFDCLRRISKDVTKGLNGETVEYAYGKNLISDWEKDFSFNTGKKRVLSDKQAVVREKINRKIIAGIKRKASVSSFLSQIKREYQALP